MEQTSTPMEAGRVDISIIVPVYNNVQYLRAALDSILTQGLDSLEVITIDDGSTDGSGIIMDDFASKHPFVRVIKQENQGVAAARNAALDCAIGTYVTFLDGDDVLRPGALSDMLLVAEKRGADLVIGEARSVRTFKTTMLRQSQKLSMKSLIERDDPELVYNFSNCNKVFRRSVIEDNDIRYKPIKHAEDGLFLYEFLSCCGLITGCPRYVYEYRKRLSIEAKSALKTLDISMFESGMKACQSILELTQDWPEAFRAELNVRILRITLMSEYYRRMWVLDQESLDRVLDEMNKLKDIVGEEKWAYIYSLNEDLECEDHIKGMQEMLDDPLLGIIVLRGMDNRQFLDYLSTLYFQTCPNYEVWLDESYRSWTPDEYSSKKNLHFIDCSGSIGEVIGETRGRYIQIVDKPCIYNEDTLRLMARRLKESEAEFVSIKPLHYKGELSTAAYHPGNDAFTKAVVNVDKLDAKRKTALEKIDGALANKLFTREAVLIAALEMGGKLSLMQSAYRHCDYKRFNNALIGFTVAGKKAKSEEPPLWRKAGSKVKQRLIAIRKRDDMLAYKKSMYRKYAKSLPVDERRVFFMSDIRAELGGNYEPLKPLIEQAGYELVCDFKPKKNIRMSKQEEAERMRNLATSAYIVLEDFHVDTADITVRPGQELVQLWHACGAFKKFAWSRAGGNENINIHPGYKKYTKAIVSSKDIRKDYADAYRIDVDKVAATGIPRTDIFFDEEHKRRVREDYLTRYPILQGKKIVLFAPTYRGTSLGKAGYDTSMIDPNELHEKLGDGYMFVFKWHPAMQQRLASEKKQAYDYESMADYALDLSSERDINDLLILADVLVTDYSSVIFEYALLDKPIVYYWYDVNEYIIGRGMYYDMDEYVYGEVAYNEEMLPAAIAAETIDEEKRSRFLERFMSACDGKSSEKTFEFIFGKDTADGGAAGE